MVKYIIPWSGGKDSTATIIIAQMLGLDFEVHSVELMYDKSIPANPELADFKRSASQILGFNYIVHSSATTYKDIFLRVKKRGLHVGKLYGGLMSMACAMQHLKVQAFKDIPKDNIILGIAYDEPQRMKSDTFSLLYSLGVTESGAFELCRQFGVLAPTYLDDSRDGCFFCPNGIKRLPRLAQKYPEIFADYKALWFDNSSRLTTQNYSWKKNFRDVFNVQLKLF